MEEDLSVFDNIIFYLNNNGYEYELMEHDHVHSSADAAKVRGTNLEEAAKAIVLRAKKDGEKKYFMCVVSGHRKLNLKEIKKLVECKNVSLAHPDDVFSVTGLRVGTIPPLPFMFSIDGYADRAVLEKEYVVFSAASHHKSIRMKSADWQELSGVAVEDIGKDVQD